MVWPSVSVFCLSNWSLLPPSITHLQPSVICLYTHPAPIHPQLTSSAQSPHSQERNKAHKREIHKNNQSTNCHHQPWFYLSGPGARTQCTQAVVPPSGKPTTLIGRKCNRSRGTSVPTNGKTSPTESMHSQRLLGETEPWVNSLDFSKRESSCSLAGQHTF